LYSALPILILSGARALGADGSVMCFSSLFVAYQRDHTAVAALRREKDIYGGKSSDHPFKFSWVFLLLSAELTTPVSHVGSVYRNN
jgi:hypothetical protein